MPHSPPYESALQSQTARNRENQRAFRARRQQYVQELEAKLQAYEHAEVQATRRVQDAARIVLDENRILRDMLREGLNLEEGDVQRLVLNARQQRGCSNGRISSDQFKSNPGAGQEGSGFDGESVMLLPPQTPGISSLTQTSGSFQYPKSSRMSTIAVSPEPTTTQLQPRQDGSPAPESSSLQYSFPQEGPNRVHLDNGRSVPGWDGVAISSHPLKPSCSPNSGPDQMSCEEAAAIITSIRIDPSTVADVRQELGCGPHDSCTVPNKDVFQVINAYV